ncbi:hypothetical protein ACFLTP_01175 [Chloroflexota bacterium]
MNNVPDKYRITVIILLMAAIAVILYIIALKIAYPIFQSTWLIDPLAEVKSLFPFYYIAITIVALLGVACFVFRVESRGIHVLLVILMAVMLWYTHCYLAGYTWEPDGPRNLGVSLLIPEVLNGAVFHSSNYGASFPLSYILEYTVANATGASSSLYLHLMPLVNIVIFTLLCYTFTSSLFRPLTAFMATLLAILGMHYMIFIMGAHTYGVLLLLTILVLIWRKDTASRILAILAIGAVIISHPISPILLGIFLSAALLAYFSRSMIKSRLVLAIILLVCMGGWFIWGWFLWPTLSSTQTIGEAIEAIMGNIFTGSLATISHFLVGKAFYFDSIFNINRAIYALYGLTAALAVLFVFARARVCRKGARDFLSRLGGLTREELFLAISMLLLIVLSVLLAEVFHTLIERGLTFIILTISGVIASIVTRVYEPAKTNVRRFMAGSATVVIVFLTLAFPLVAYSIDAYTSFPVSEESGLKFLAESTPLDAKTLTTTSGPQISLYQPYVAKITNMLITTSFWESDILIFRMTGYYYAAMRYDFSFEDNRLTRYRDAVNTNAAFNSVYINPTTHIFIRR